jgi:hypothetical protein
LTAGKVHKAPATQPRRGIVGLLIHLLILPFRRPIVAMMLGVAIVGAVLAYDWEQPPSCGGQTMDRTSVCRRLTDSDGSHDKTYDDMLEQQGTAPYFWGGLGGVLVLGGAVSWPIRRRRAARAAATAAN